MKGQLGTDRFKMSKDVKGWVSKRASEIAYEEVIAEGKHLHETADDVAKVRFNTNPEQYLILAILDYLEELK